MYFTEISLVTYLFAFDYAQLNKTIKKFILKLVLHLLCWKSGIIHTTHRNSKKVNLFD